MSGLIAPRRGTSRGQSRNEFLKVQFFRRSTPNFTSQLDFLQSFTLILVINNANTSILSRYIFNFNALLFFEIIFLKILETSDLTHFWKWAVI